MKVSLVLATYNGEPYLEQQLESIRTQTRVPDEIIIGDDHSTDRTVLILEEYQKAHPELPIMIFRNGDNLGYRRNFRRLLRDCSGDVIFLCDQDDVWNPEKIEKMAGFFTPESSLTGENRSSQPDTIRSPGHPGGQRRDGALLNVQAVACSFDLINGDGRKIHRHHRSGWSNQNLYHRVVRRGDLVSVRPEDISFHNFCQGCALAFTREVKDRFLAIDSDELPHDWLINLCAAAGGGLYFYNEPLFRYRIHGDNAQGLAVRAGNGEKMRTGYRTLEAELALTYMKICEQYFRDIWNDDLELRNRRLFLEQYLRDMQNGRTGDLMKLSFRKYYRELKALKGRLGDIAFTMIHPQG